MFSRGAFELLRFQFSSGVTMRELASVAEVLAITAGTTGPGREEKRSFRALIGWFVRSWAVIGPWIPSVALRDAQGHPITGGREREERKERLLGVAL
jgi:hypothetical protein